jgi:hypothetical protein
MGDPGEAPPEARLAVAEIERWEKLKERIVTVFASPTSKSSSIRIRHILMK